MGAAKCGFVDYVSSKMPTFRLKKVVTQMTRSKASSNFIFIFVAIDFLIHNETRNIERWKDRIKTKNWKRSSLPPKVRNQWSVIGWSHCSVSLPAYVSACMCIALESLWKWPTDRGFSWRFVQKKGAMIANSANRGRAGLDEYCSCTLAR
jgi:hypothetical protein